MKIKYFFKIRLSMTELFSQQFIVLPNLERSLKPPKDFMNHQLPGHKAVSART